MTRYFLTRVRIEGFRGINNEGQPLELKFKPDSVNSIFAQNGTGKSSIYEALCFAIKGSVPKLKALQVGENPEMYVTNLFHTTQMATIELDLTSDSGSIDKILVTRSPSSTRTVTSPSGHPDPEALLASLNEDFTLLDYEQFTRFIDNTPLERGRSFSALLGLSGYSAMRQLLQALNHGANLKADFSLDEIRVAIDLLEAQGNRALARFKTHYTALTGKQVADTSTVGQWGAEVLRALSEIELLKSALDGKKLSTIDFPALRRLVQEAEGGDQKDRLNSLIKDRVALKSIRLTDSSTVTLETTALEGLLRRRDELLKLTRGAAYRSVQEVGKRLLESDDWDSPTTCPLCGTSLSEPLIEHVRTELATYVDLQVLEQQVAQHVRETGWLRTLHDLESVPSIQASMDRPIATSTRSAVLDGTVTAQTLKDAVSRLEALRAALTAQLSSLDREVEVLQKQLPPSLVVLTTQIEHGDQARSTLTEYWRATNELKVRREQKQRYDRWLSFIGRATADLCRAESELSQARLGALGAKYQELFNDIMMVGDIVPELHRAEGTEQLDVRLGDFHGRTGLSARALLSESYRNALAIAVFLSAASTQEMVPRFVVLDDVTSSFDAGHQWRLMDQIRLKLQYRGAGTDGLQFIMLSHDGLLEKYFDSMSAGSGWHHQKLQGMPALGSIETLSQSGDRIRQAAEGFLNSGQISAAEPLIRQYLEFSLLRIIQKLGIPVPYDFAIKDSNKMVGNCLTAITDAVKLHAAAGSLVLTTQQQGDLETRFVPQIIGNYVSHYATAVNAGVSAPVLLGVIRDVDALSDCFKREDSSKTPPVKVWYRSLSKA